MLQWYEWLIFVILILLMVIGGLFIYGALTGSTTLIPQTIVPHVGTLPTVTTNNGTVVNIITGGSDPYNCGAVGAFCDPTLGLTCRSGQCVCSITGTTFCRTFFFFFGLDFMPSNESLMQIVLLKLH